MSQCTVGDCGKEDRGGGFCSAHRHRLRRYGDPLGGPRAPYFLPPEERFWHYVDKTTSDKGCWLWKSRGRTQDGYVTFEISTEPGNRQSMLAHRYAWRLKHGRDPLNELHHICYIRDCVNPDHLVEATRQQNLEDGNGRRRLERLAYEYLLRVYDQNREGVDKMLADMDNGLQIGAGP